MKLFNKSGADSGAKNDETTAVSDINTNKVELTKLDITDYLVKNYRGFPTALLVIGIIVALIFGAVAFFERSLIYLSITVFVIALSVYANFKYRNFINRAYNMEFYIEKDVCIKKYDVDGQEGGSTTYYMIFQKHGKHRLRTPTYSTKMNTCDFEIYHRANTGDSYYLVFFEKSSQIRMVIPANEYELYFGDFSCENGRYYPIGDKDAKKLLEHEYSVEKSNLTSEEITKINDAHNSFNNFKIKSKQLLVFTFLFALLTVVAVFSKTVCVLSIIFSLPMLAVPIIIALKASRKSLDAYNTIKSIKYEYERYQQKQNKTGTITALSIFGSVILWIINIVILATFHT